MGLPAFVFICSGLYALAAPFVDLGDDNHRNDDERAANGIGMIVNEVPKALGLVPIHECGQG